MKTFVLPSVVLVVAGLGVVRTVTLEEQLSEALGRPAVPAGILRGVRGELAEIRNQVSALRERAEASHEEELSQAVCELDARLASAGYELATAGQRLDDLERFESGWREEERAELDQRVRDLRQELEERWGRVTALRESDARLASENRARLEHLQSAVEASLVRTSPSSDRSSLWPDLLGPSVQVSGDATVGSGVLLASRPRTAGDGWRTHVLTAWHVVRDVYGSGDPDAGPVPVKVYQPGGEHVRHTADLVLHDADIDVALLELRTHERLPYGARIASRQRLESAAIFDPVYAVGCPLGNDPIPTAGQIASTTHEIDGRTYWMLSAPTYIGNSGGGVFDAQSHELLALFSKIYTHGSLRSTIIPHMGLATPMTDVVDWLEANGYGQLVSAGDPAALAAGAARGR